MNDNYFDQNKDLDDTTDNPYDPATVIPATEPAQTAPHTPVQPEPSYAAPSFYEDIGSEKPAPVVTPATPSAYTSPSMSAYGNTPTQQPEFTDPYRPYTTSPAGTPYAGTAQPNADGYYHHSYVTPTPAPKPAPKKEKKPRAKVSGGALALILVLCIIVSGFAGFGGAILAGKLSHANDLSADTMIVHKVEASTTTETTGLVDKTTAEITAEVADSVVEITTEVMQTSGFYGQYIAQGAGSGVIIDTDGYIITNNHVIDGASSIKVTLRSGESYTAELIGKDAAIDIALLKIDAKDLSAAVFGDSDTLSVGDKSVIIGNPLGTLGGSVTEGIISALDRAITIDDRTMHLLQTDAAINPGNSGGGLFNGQGELCGIVVAKSSNSGSGEATIDNIGFVIPINNVLDILADLKEVGYVRGRAATGMEFVDLSNSMYSMYYYGNQNTGCYIYSVQEGSNAYEAGFRAGDRVVSIDGEAVSTSADINKIISTKSAGDTVKFELERQNATGTLSLKLEEDVPEDSVSHDNNSQNNSPFSRGFGF